jgi:integrase
MKPRRPRGTGSIYRPRWKDNKTGELIEGEIYWIRYYANGRVYRESSHSDNVKQAQNLLKKRYGEITQGKEPGIYFDRVKFDELANDFLTDYRINGKDTISEAERSVRYLKEFFGGMKAVDITTTRIQSYIEKRIQANLSSASINRELAALKRMFHLGKRANRVSEIPYIPMLKENNIRKGFFEHGEYLAIKEVLPEELKPIIAFAYHSGWRKAEILGLTWDRVDISKGTASLDPGETKNEKGRTLYMNEELLMEIRKLHSKRQLGCPYVFHRNGIPIRGFQKAWATACIKAGLQGKIFHDFRRTAIRDLVRSGTPERVAMEISGHKTRSVFDRYNIVSEQDLKEAAIRQQAYHASQQDSTMGIAKRREVIPLRGVAQA